MCVGGGVGGFIRGSMVERKFSNMDEKQSTLKR